MHVNFKMEAEMQPIFSKTRRNTQRQNKHFYLTNLFFKKKFWWTPAAPAQACLFLNLLKISVRKFDCFTSHRFAWELNIDKR